MSARGIPALQGQEDVKTVGTAIRVRLGRELRDLIILGAAVAFMWVLARLLSAVAPFSVWWPATVALVVLGLLVVTCPEGLTVVRHGVSSAVSHPLHSVIVVALVLLPHLGVWAGDAVAAGTSRVAQSVTQAVPHPSLPSFHWPWSTR